MASNNCTTKSTVESETTKTTDSNGHLAIEGYDVILDDEAPPVELKGPTNIRVCCKYGPVAWCKKYFFEGQLHEKSPEVIGDDPDNPPVNGWRKYFDNSKRLIGLMVPVCITLILWFALVIRNNYWHHFNESWYMTVTMVFGSLIAGMTSEGGGSVAFPVMTLGFNIHPSVARDFSMWIQTTGMGTASATILIMGIQLEWNTLIWSSLGGAIGLITGLELVDPYLTPAAKKLGFVSIWFSFAFALFLLNRYHKRPTFPVIPQIKLWKVLVLVMTGFCGGIFTSFSGSGLDICSFSILTLLFRVSEKVATPTSVVLMATNSMLGVFYRGAVMRQISNQCWSLILCCAQISFVQAPVGALVGSHFHRLVLASFVYVTDTVGLICGFVIVPLSPALVGVSISIIVFGFCFFIGITKAGEKLLEQVHQEIEEQKVVKKKEIQNGNNGQEMDGMLNVVV